MQQEKATNTFVYVSRVPICLGAGRCRGGHGAGSNPPCHIKPLPALAALGATKTHPSKHKPLSVTFSLAFVFQACGKPFPRFHLLFHLVTGTGTSAQPRHFPQLILAPGCFPSSIPPARRGKGMSCLPRAH